MPALLSAESYGQRIKWPLCRPRVTPFVVTGRWGYAPVGAQGPPELYHLAEEPVAEQDIADDNAGQVQELHGLFLEHLREHGASDACIALWDRARDGGDGTWAVDYSVESE